MAVTNEGSVQKARNHVPRQTNQRSTSSHYKGNQKWKMKIKRLKSVLNSPAKTNYWEDASFSSSEPVSSANSSAFVCFFVSVPLFRKGKSRTRKDVFSGAKAVQQFPLGSADKTNDTLRVEGLL